MAEGYFKHRFSKDVYYAKLIINTTTGGLEVARYPINQDCNWDILTLEHFSRVSVWCAGNLIRYYSPCDVLGNELPISEWPDNELYRAFEQETNYDKDSMNEDNCNEKLMNFSLGYFKHYKNLNKDGAIYYATIGQHTESKMLFAVYRPVSKSHEIWVRPLDMFMGYVRDSDGIYVRRFLPCDVDGNLLK